ncbi:hypothetical protein [Chryseobacterium indologenes]|uniref:hypothetical protein n=1 Tax=Chryseobacterium indologenes TaxID=253 RepID=UPI0011AB720B|nr:hypothetical protein [Chryseobacterium indologenes]
MMKKIKLLMLMALALFLFGCRTELSDNSETNISQSDYRKTVKLKEALAFKNYLTEAKSNPSQVYSKNADSFSALSDESTVTVIVQNNVTSYSTVVRHLDRSSDVLVYSIDNENKSIGFTAKYTPEDRTKNYQIDNFTGTVEFTALDGRPMGMKEFSNGAPLPDKVAMSKNSMNKAGCSFSIRLIEVECNGEHHSPSQIAQCTASQKPYYIVEITEVCSGGGQPPKGFPNMGTYDGGGSSTGGGTTNEMSIQDSFNYMLGEAGLPELTSDEYTYIQNNQYIGGQLLSYFYNNLNQNNSQFLHWSINYFKNYADLNISPNAAYKQFQNWFIDPNGNPNITFENFTNSNNVLTFHTMSEFENFLANDINNSSYSEATIFDNGQEKITRLRVNRMGIYNTGINIEIKLKKTNNLWTYDSVTSEEYIGIGFVYEWAQSNYTSNTNNNVLSLEVFGYEKVGVSLVGIDVKYKNYAKVLVKINQTTGQIISASFIDLPN